MRNRINHDRLLAALTDLPRTRREALRTLPDILSRQGEGHTTVSIIGKGQPRIIASNDPALPEGFLLPETSVVTACAQLRESIYLPDAPADPRYHAPYGRLFPVELALPIFERGNVVAVLNIERHQPFSRPERRTLELFVAGVGERLTERSQSREAKLIAELSSKLADTTTLEEAADLALQILIPLLGARFGTILSEEPGFLRPLAAVGLQTRIPETYEGVPYPEGLAWRAVLTGEAQFSGNYQSAEHAWDKLHDHLPPVVMVHPVSRQGVCHTVLTLHLQPEVNITEADLIIIDNACRHLALLFHTVRVTRFQDMLLELQMQITESGTHQLYQQILETAIAVVPGAEAGTLLVRRNPDGPFQYQAAVGHDLTALQTIEFDEPQMRAWHGLTDQAWLDGELRILDRTPDELDTRSVRTSGRTELARIGRLDSLMATVSLPAVYRGRVLAALNLDNFTRERAFGTDSLQALKLFKAPVASMLQEAHHRDAIMRASLTDPVTSLPNRRAFESELQLQMARSARSREPFTLLLMDLTNFKAINDTLGHDSGDAALRLVATALQEQHRAGEIVARWGGDEFTALLPGTGPSAALHVATRFQNAVAQLEVSGLPLGIDIGLASYPEAGRTAPELLRVADRRMYAGKSMRKQDKVLG